MNTTITKKQIKEQFANLFYAKEYFDKVTRELKVSHLPVHEIPSFMDGGFSQGQGGLKVSHNGNYWVVDWVENNN